MWQYVLFSKFILEPYHDSFDKRGRNVHVYLMLVLAVLTLYEVIAKKY